MSDAPTSPPPNWEDVLKRLEVVLESVGDLTPDLHRRVPSDDLWQFKALVDTGEDIFMTTIVSLHAVDALRKESVGRRDLDPFAAKGHDREVVWAADPANHNRPGWTIVAMGAMAWCHVLEGFLSGISATALDRGAIARVRIAFPDAAIPSDNAERARETILARMLPSTKRNGRSLRYLEAAYACTLDPTIGIALRSLVSFRNQVAHPKRGRTHDDHRVSPSSAEWIAWAASVRALAGTVIRALADRLDERRAIGEVIPIFPGRGNP